MAAQSMSSTDSIQRRPQSTSWLTARPMWAGLAIISMWLAVLFVGVFGGTILSSTPGGGSKSVPVVVVVAGVALLGTLVVGRRAFFAAGADDDLHRELEDERQARERLAAEVAELRAKLSSR
jgi:hypothetical protein